MKRKRLILTTLLLACVAAVVVPNMRAIWLTVAYEEVEVGGVRFLEKMSSCWPGYPLAVRDHVCQSCLNDTCSACDHGWSLPMVVEPMPSGFPPGSFVTSCFGPGQSATPASRTVPSWKEEDGMMYHHPQRFQRRKESRAHMKGLGLCDVDGVAYCSCPDPSHEWNR